MTASSSVEFLIWLLIAASIIAIIAERFRIPYTAALVAGGLVLGLLPVGSISPLDPANRPHWLTPNVILIVFLPALVFEGSVKLNVRALLRDWLPLLILANFGVLLATLVTGCLVFWWVGLPLLVAFLFGAIISATDPISVLAIFKNKKIDERLSIIIEGESLLNDGTAAVLFQIILAGILAGRFNLLRGIGDFFLQVLGGALLGVFLGYAASKITARIDDPQIEITLTTLVAYGSYLLAFHLHLSGIIATASAGLVVGNFGKHEMGPQTKTALEAFWEYVAFVMNSVIFLLIGLEVHVGSLLRSYRIVLLAILAVLIGRALSVYLLVPATNAIAEQIPFRWQHVLFWGGLRGALALALALSLDNSFPHRGRLLDLTFGVVVFSILVQALTIKALVKWLRLAPES
jgi:CPA1 family monovalent cation:H+ antiporter